VHLQHFEITFVAVASAPSKSPLSATTGLGLDSNPDPDLDARPAA
jgi:hypothetical protein